MSLISEIYEQPARLEKLIEDQYPTIKALALAIKKRENSLPAGHPRMPVAMLIICLETAINCR